jgi:hypothetical protein
MEASAKFRSVGVNPNAAFVLDDDGGGGRRLSLRRIGRNVTTGKVAPMHPRVHGKWLSLLWTSAVLSARR